MQVLLKRLLVFKKIDDASYESSIANLGNFPWRNFVSSPALSDSDVPVTEEQLDTIEEHEAKISQRPPGAHKPQESSGAQEAPESDAFDPNYTPPSFEEEHTTEENEAL